MHVPVLAGPAIEWLHIRETGVYVDCTAGAGGHSELIAQRLRGGRLIALDRDPNAVALAAERLRPYSCTQVIHRNYGDLAAVLDELAIPLVDGVLVDAGVSSMQLDTAARGFSLQESGPLDMRMDPSHGLSAADFLRTLDEARLAEILKTYGDVPRARRIAAAILRRRDAGRLDTTDDLAAAIAEGLNLTRPPEETRTVFQAIRIAVNEELRWLEAGLTQAIDRLAPEGRLVAISFHSGEDRVIKNTLRDASRKQVELYPDGRVRRVTAPRVTVLTPKPILPTREEVSANPRAHSAKMRVVERIAKENDR